MKIKKIYVGMAIAAMSISVFSACTSEIEQSSIADNSTAQLTFTADNFEYEVQKRTDFNITAQGAEFKWAENDTVGIFPSEGSQVYFSMSAGSGTKTATFDGGGWALKSSSTYSAYYPFKGNIYLDKTAIPISYNGQKQIGNNSTAHLGAYDYMTAIASTPENGNVNFHFKHLGALLQINLEVPEANTELRDIRLYADGVFEIYKVIDLTQNTYTPDVFTGNILLSLENIKTTKDNQRITLYMMVPPTDLSEHSSHINVHLETPISTLYENIPLEIKSFEAGKAYSISASLPCIEYRTITLTEAGTLDKALQIFSSGATGLKYTLESLKIIGPINGTDIKTLREMLGKDINGKDTPGKLTSLDLSEATIVEGGDAYYKNGDQLYYTENNVIGTYMFMRSNLTDIKIPVNTNKIGMHAFTYSKIKGIELHPNITFDFACFQLCESLTKMTIPDGPKETPEYMLALCSSLEQVTFPSSLTRINYYSLSGCPNLSDIYIYSNNVTLYGGFEPVFGFYDSVVDTKKCIIHVPKGTLESYKQSSWNRFDNIVEME